jgi:hypothetical protein
MENVAKETKKRWYLQVKPNFYVIFVFLYSHSAIWWRRIVWATHAISIRELKNAQKFVFVKPEGKRQRDTPRHSSEGNV